MQVSIPLIAGVMSNPIVFEGHSGDTTFPSQVPSVTAVPGTGGSILVQYSTSPAPAVANGTANWASWPAGTVTAYTTDTLVGKVTALQALATGANGTLEVCA